MNFWLLSLISLKKGGGLAGEKKGVLYDDRLFLDGENILMKYMISAFSRERMLIYLDREVELGENTLKHAYAGAITLQTKSCKELTNQINRIASKINLDHVKTELQRENKSNLFRSIECGHCESTVNSSFETITPYLYCPYCTSILTKDGMLVSNGDDYDICRECGLFDRRDLYDDFLFYFLLFIYGFRNQKKGMCPVDAKKMAKSNILKNLIFVIGVFPALRVWQQSNKRRKLSISGLPEANEVALDNGYLSAKPQYDALIAEHGTHPGILYNISSLQIAQGLEEGYQNLTRLVKEVCVNYQPAVSLIRRLQSRT